MIKKDILRTLANSLLIPFEKFIWMKLRIPTYSLRLKKFWRIEEYLFYQTMKFLPPITATAPTPAPVPTAIGSISWTVPQPPGRVRVGFGLRSRLDDNQGHEGDQQEE